MVADLEQLAEVCDAATMTDRPGLRDIGAGTVFDDVDVHRNSALLRCYWNGEGV